MLLELLFIKDNSYFLPGIGLDSAEVSTSIGYIYAEKRNFSHTFSSTVPSMAICFYVFMYFSVFIFYLRYSSCTLVRNKLINSTNSELPQYPQTNSVAFATK